MSRRLNLRNFITIASVAILVGTEIMGAAFAAAYALGSLFELERNLVYGLVGLAAVLGLWLLWKFILLANRVEPVFDAGNE